MTDQKFKSLPHIFHPDSVLSINLHAFLALTPLILWGFYVFGIRVILQIMFSVVSAEIFEWLFNVFTKKSSLSDHSALITGTVIALSLPAASPFFVLPIANFVAIVIVKGVFGGTGKNFVNPSLAAKAFLLVALPEEISRFTLPEVMLPKIENVNADILKTAVTSENYYEKVTSLIPDKISVNDFVIGKFFGNVGEISALLVLLCGLFLIITGTETFHAPLAFVGTVFILDLFVLPDNGADLFLLESMLSGGVLFGAFFYAGDPVTTPVTSVGKLIFGAGCGILTFFFRRHGLYREAVTFSVLIMNLLVWYIDKITMPLPYGRKRGAKWTRS